MKSSENKYRRELSQADILFQRKKLFVKDAEEKTV
jgi:hypothetical protein